MRFHMLLLTIPHTSRLSCIFLAGKAEDNFVNIQELFKIYPKFPEAKILECEIVLLEVT